jgi:predicted  nucleic acid-binding Zn-ribbon protein
MSEERFDRLESQLTQVIQGMAVMQQNMTVMQQNMATKQDLAAVEQKVSGIEQKVSGIEQKISSMQNNIDAAREDISSLRRRIESNEGTLIVTIREGFRSREVLLDDLNFDLADNERKTRRLARRVSRLERNNND